MTSTDYGQDVLIDGLNVSNWDSPGVYESLRNGNVTAINATIATWHNFQETLEEIELWGPRLARYGDSVMQVETVDDILTAKREGRTGIILGFQNASPIENRLDRLGSLPPTGGTDHTGHLPRAEPAGERLLRAQGRRSQQLRPRRGQGDEQPRYPYRPLPCWDSDDDGDH